MKQTHVLKIKNGKGVELLQSLILACVPTSGQQTAWNRVNQGPRPEDPQTQSCGHMLLTKLSQTRSREKIDSLTNDAGKLDFPRRKIKLKPWFPPYTKINSKLIKELNIRAESLKLLEKNLGEEYFNTEA